MLYLAPFVLPLARCVSEGREKPGTACKLDVTKCADHGE